MEDERSRDLADCEREKKGQRRVRGEREGRGTDGIGEDVDVVVFEERLVAERDLALVGDQSLGQLGPANEASVETHSQIGSSAPVDGQVRLPRDDRHLALVPSIPDLLDEMLTSAPSSDHDDPLVVLLGALAVRGAGEGLDLGLFAFDEDLAVFFDDFEGEEVADTGGVLDVAGADVESSACVSIVSVVCKDSPKGDACRAKGRCTTRPSSGLPWRAERRSVYTSSS